MKKTIVLVLLVISTFMLIACEAENTAPTLSGVANTSSPYGVEFDPMAGVSAYDAEDGNLTADIDVTGTLDRYTVSEYTFVYTVNDSKGLSATATRKVNVLPLTEATLATGWYDYKFATADVKHTFFAAAEKWLLENGYAGIPLAAQSGLTIQHERVVLPVDEYIPSFGWGTNYATITQDDAKVASDNGGQLDLLQTTAQSGKYTYRTWASLEPDTLNYYNGESTTESDFGAYINGGFYRAVLNDSATGWEFAPELAEDDPIAVNGTVVNGKLTSKVWQIPLRDGLKWAYNEGTDTSGFPVGHDVLDAHDYEYTYRLALDNEWFRATQGGGDFVSSKVKGAEAYAAAVARNASKTELDNLWAQFGIHASADGKTLTVEYTEAVSEFNFKYQFGAPAVNQAVYEANPELYGTEPKYVASSGLYRITYWEDGVGSRYEKVDTHPLASTIAWTGESIKIIEGTSAQDQAFQAFENGLLDSVGVPNSRVPDFKDDPRVLRTPGASVWSLNMNMVGSTQAQQAQWPGSTYTPEPILANRDFRLALYFALDRDDMVQYDAKTYPTSMKISAAYYVDAESGIPYRSTEQGIAVGENLAYSTNGYDPEAAQALFKKAVAEEIAKGTYVKGTAENYTVIDLEVLTFDANSGAAIADNWINFAKDYWELLVDDTNFVKVQVTPKKTPGSQIYDDIEAGNYELGLSSISGSTLDASSFLDTFMSDNRSGFLLNYGYDSNVPEIEVRWNDNGVERFELFSFDAIYELLTSKVYLKDGKKIEEYGTVDDLVAIFLNGQDLTEVKRSADDGAAVLPVLLRSADEILEETGADEVIALLVTAKDTDDVQSQYLVVITKTGNIYEVYNTQKVNIASTLDDAFDAATEGVTFTDKVNVPEAELDDLVLWFEYDLSVYDEVYASYLTTGNDKTLVVLGKAGNFYFVIGVETLVTADAAGISAVATPAVTQYGYTVFNLREVTTNERLLETGYMATTYDVETLEDVAALQELPANMVKVYEFDLDANGNQRAAGDIYILVVVVAGFVVYATWL